MSPAPATTAAINALNRLFEGAYHQRRISTYVGWWTSLPNGSATLGAMRSKLARVLIVLVGAVPAGAFVFQPGIGGASSAPVARTTGGVVRGVAEADHDSFRGIPYAAPPVGELRWRAPQAPASWTGIRDATTPGQPCPQRGRPGQPPVGNEDCLYLNVVTPAGARTDARLPVMVWLHGGGFTGGTGSDYDPARLVESGRVVVVTLNYRLGALGFLDLPELAAHDPYAGNYALADQQAALRWIRANAHAFGGNPANVTLFGQSAGGIAVCAHLAAPSSTGLFQKAIVQSGPCGNDLITGTVAQQRGTVVATALGCPPAADTLACLRAKPAADLVGTGVPQDFTAAGLSSTSWEFVAGTPAIPQQPLLALQDGTAVAVPLIQGSTHDEMRQTVASLFDQRGAPLTATDYPTVVTQLFGDHAPGVLARYPVTAYPSPGLALATLLTDWGHAVGACRVLLADDAAARRAPVYAYEFEQDGGRHVGEFPLGATHGSDLPYLFDGTFTFTPPPPPDPTLSGLMITYWTRFARTGNPNVDAAPSWPRYHSSGPVLALTAGHTAPVDFAADHQCAFWNGLP
jgi:para-nitrobenzyl esterase